MTTAYTSLLGLALPVTGELSGTWGDTVNNSITSLLDSAIAGTTTLSADTTLTTTTGASNQARQAILLCTGHVANITITAPAQSKIYTVINASATYTVKIRGVGPTTGITIPVSSTATVAWNGSDFVDASGYINGNLKVNGTLTVTSTSTLTGNTTIGAGSGSPQLKLSGAASSTANSGAQLAFAAAGTPYAYISNVAWIKGGGSTDNNLAYWTDTGLGHYFYANNNATTAVVAMTSSLLTVTPGATIQGLTVGLGGGAVSTNTVVGLSALSGANTGGYNVAIGNGALSANTSGVQNTAVGSQAGLAITTGSNNVAIGRVSMYANTVTGSDNSALGVGSLYNLTSGASNTAIGGAALFSNNSASNNTAVGYQAGYTNQTGAQNVFVGRVAGYFSTTSYNTAVGDSALYSNISGAANSAFGQGALQNNTASTITGVGYSAGYNNTSGTQNTYLGAYAGYYNKTGINNTALGYGSLGFNILTGFSTGSENTAVGSLALYAISSGGSNTAVGYNAGPKVTSGGENVLIGVNAGQKLTTGAGNTIIGRNAGIELVSGSSNVIIGLKTGVGGSGQNVTGSQNTFVGPGAGSYVTSGANNTLIGGYDGLAAPVSQTGSNNIVLSDGGGNTRFNYVNASNSWQMPYFGGTSTGRGGNTILSMSSGAVAYDGSFQITDAVANNVWWGLLNGNAYVMVNTLGVNLASGTTAWASASDSRLKNVTGTYLTALSDIAQIDVVKFTWKSDEKARPCVGVIAQSVQGVVPEAVDEFTENDEQYLSVRYTELIPLMIASIKELKAEVNSLKSQLNGA